jgi:hypothetical protein
MSKSRADVNRYYHGGVDRGTGISADYVVEHAARQRQRGRKPAVNYQEYKNPRDSLAAAQADIHSRTSGNDRFAEFAGRIILIRVWSERQKDRAGQYVEGRLSENGAVGAIIREVEHDETLQAPLHFRIVDNGTAEALLPI